MSMTTIFTNDRQVVAWAVGLDLPRVHALLDEAIYALPQPFARLTAPIERIAAPGVIAGWGVTTAAPSSYAPSLPAVIEMVIPTSDADDGELTQHQQWRSLGLTHVGWAVTDARLAGPWQSFTTAEAELARHGLRWMDPPVIDDPGFDVWVEMVEQARAAQEGEYTLTPVEIATLDVVIDGYYRMTGETLDGLLGAHRLGHARARLMQRMAATEAADE
jgi:hypothetical protein